MRTLGPALAGALLLACREPDDPLRTDLFIDICDQIFDCTCDEYPYTDRAECERVLAADHAALRGAAEALGLTLDDECVRAQHRDILERRCMTNTEYWEAGGPNPPTCERCSLAHGAVALGDPCTDYGGFSDCASGLVCHARTCVDPCRPLAAGEPCTDTPGTCGDGLFCLLHDDGRCVPFARDGEPCESAPCLDGLICKYSEAAGASLCRPVGMIGAPCFYDYDCQDGLLCFDDLAANTNLCRSPAGDGESCEDIKCAQGLSCEFEAFDARICRPTPGLGEPCTNRCDGYTYCEPVVGVTGVCRRLPGIGEPCHHGCDRNVRCDLDSGICVREQPLLCGG
jgi:hypothetical protein